MLSRSEKSIRSFLLVRDVCILFGTQRLHLVPNEERTMHSWVHSYMEELRDGEDGTDLLRHMNYEFGARCDAMAISKELEALVNDSNDMVNALGTLTEALDMAAEYGWVWPVRGVYADDPPHVGDSVWFERLEPKVCAFVEAYRRSATFMSRKGQRSQHVGHTSLDPCSGLTESQKRKRRVQLHMRRERRRARTECEDKERAQRDADVLRMQKLTEELEHLREKQACVS